MRSWFRQGSLDKPKRETIKPILLYPLGALILIGIIGSTLTLSAINERSRLLNADLMDESSLAAMSINVAQIEALTGTDADLTSPDYRNLKKLLTEERKFVKKSRFVYHVGQKPDGTLF